MAKTDNQEGIRPAPGPGGQPRPKRKRQRPGPGLEGDFTGGGIHALSAYTGSTGDAGIDRAVAELVDAWGPRANPSLVAEMIITALKIGRDEVGVGELKLINRSLKEMRAANRVFGPYRDRPKVTVYGSARTAAGQPAYLAAREFSLRMRDAGWMTITGAGDGIMGAAQEGAGRDGSFGLNINLPFEQGANETIDGDHKLLTFNYFFTRKLSFVKEANAFALFPGGFGTMDEGFELLTLMQTGKVAIMPVVLVDRPGGTYWKSWHHFIDVQLLAQGLVSENDFSLFKVTDSVQGAVDEIVGFYRVFHSYRWVRERMVVRLRERLAPGAVEALDREFGDLFPGGGLVQGEALPEEGNEPALAELPRLVGVPVRREFGRLRQFIDALNRAETTASRGRRSEA